MCGSGRYLIPYLKENFMIEGFDASSYMLDKLQKKLSDQSLQTRVWQGFCEDILPTEQYKLIFIPSGSFGHIVDLSKVKEALENFYNALSHKGILVFEVETSHALPKNLDSIITQEVQIDQSQHIKLLRKVNIDADIVTCNDRYELYEDQKLLKTEDELFCVRLYNNPKTLIDFLTQLGFKSVKTIKTFERNSTPDHGDASIIYECTK